MAGWKPCRGLQEVLDQAWSDATEQGVEVPDDGEERWPHLLGWLVRYLECPLSDKGLWRAWREMVRAGDAPPAPTYSDHCPVVFVRGWIAGRRAGSVPAPNGRWKWITKAAWTAGADRGRMAWMDATRRAVV